MKKSEYFFPIVVVVNLLFICSVAALSLQSSQFSFDSWSYFDISQNLFSNFMGISGIRQFQYPVFHNVSFPVFFPFLIAILNGILKTQIFSGVIINFAVALITQFLLIKVTDRLFSDKYLGVFIFLYIFTNPYYLDEAFDARAIPFSILFIALILYTMTKFRNLDARHCSLLGLIAGLAFMNRFDMLIFGVGLGIFLFFTDGNRHLKKLIFYYLIFFIVISPWVVYSIANFSELLVSDNKKLAFISVPFDLYLAKMKLINNIYSYFPNNEIGFFSQNPLDWAKIELVKVGVWAMGMINYFKHSISSLIMLILVIFFSAKLRKTTDEEDKSLFKKYFALYGAVIMLFVPVILCGLIDHRLFLPFIFATSFISVVLAYYFLSKALPALGRLKWAIYALLTINLLFMSVSNFKSVSIEKISARIDYDLSIEKYKPLIRLLQENKVESPVVFADVFSGTYKFAAMTGIKTIGPMINFNKCVFQHLLQNYPINVVYTKKREIHDWANERFDTITVKDEGNYFLLIKNARENLPALPDKCEIELYTGVYSD